MRKLILAAVVLLAMTSAAAAEGYFFGPKMGGCIPPGAADETRYRECLAKHQRESDADLNERIRQNSLLRPPASWAGQDAGALDRRLRALESRMDDVEALHAR